MWLNKWYHETVGKMDICLPSKRCGEIKVFPLFSTPERDRAIVMVRAKKIRGGGRKKRPILTAVVSESVGWLHQSRQGRTCTPTIIRSKQSDVAVFYFPHCFIVCELVRRLAGAPVIYRGTWGMQPAPLGAPSRWRWRRPRTGPGAPAPAPAAFYTYCVFAVYMH